MSDHPPAPAGSGGQPAGEPGTTDEAQEAAMMRAIMRAQEKHREGGIDPDLEDPDTGPATPV